MQRLSRLSALRALCTLLLAALACSPWLNAAQAATAPASAASAASSVNPAAPVVLTPAQAHAALQVLDDPAQRGRVEDTLRAIAAAGALATPASAPAAGTPASAAAATTTASPAQSASAALGDALRSNGLVLQIAKHAAHAAQVLVGRLIHARTALFDVGSARKWWTERLSTAQGHALLFDLLRVLLLTLAPALIVDALVRRLIARPHRAIVAHAKAAAANPGPAATAPREPAARTASTASTAPSTAREAGADRAGDEEAMRVAAGMEPADPAAIEDATPNTGSPRTQAEADATARAAIAAAPDPSAPPAQPAGRTAHHWKRLQRLPAALLLASLELLPVLAFGLCAAGVLSLFGPGDADAAAAVGQLVDTYVICRIAIAVGALLFAPDAEALRLIPFSDTSAAFAQRWTVRIVVIGGVGGLLDAAVPLGMTEDAHLALVKVVTLVGHLALAVMILQCRRPVAAAIRRSAPRNGSLAYLAHWFADIWAGVGVFVVMALWLVWALDLRGGYRELMRAGAVSLVVMLLARVVAIVAMGALGRVFDPLGHRDSMTVAQRRTYRYYPILRRLALALIGIVTFDVLLHVWGLHPGRLLVNAPIGRLLGSAIVTILVAVVVAIVIWEAANGAAERRLQAWTDAGDYVRAARLRTLLPMFRTTLLVAILVIVGLTALSQLGVNTAPLIAGASIFGVALGFGSQKLVQDFITGIFLLTENAMQVGDWVTVAGVSGTVEFLSIRTVRLRGGDGSLYTVPFSSVTTVNNTNRGIGNAAVKVLIARGADLQRAIDTLKEIGAELRSENTYKDGILSDFAYWGVDQVDGSSVTLVGQIQCKDSARWGVQREFNRRVLLRFTERGIELANPQRNFLVGLPDGTDVEGRQAGKSGNAGAEGNHGDDDADSPPRRATTRPEPQPQPRNGSSGDGRGAGRKPS
ncbi:mechanosensitive ion channel domain-containing protein [Paraburkholderia ferrariae]|uniref:mechanosensitive ion channel domain-containing protein n=1 Tax=Paraburkholderia ferrariae TaxID=386056 RepID=UPI0005AA26F9|nr:mechanosensitive ion channel domain-containing protein [Paraburkholderia ferrariae]